MFSLFDIRGITRDPCKFFKSKQRLSLGMRYWGCANYSSDYPDRRWDMCSYRQLVRTSYSVFLSYFSFKVRTNNLSCPLIIPGSAMWLPQVGQPRDPPTWPVDSRLRGVGCQKGPRDPGGGAPQRRAKRAHTLRDESSSRGVQTQGARGSREGAREKEGNGGQGQRGRQGVQSRASKEEKIAPVHAVGRAILY